MKINKSYIVDGLTFDNLWDLRQYLGNREKNAIIFGEEPTENIAEFYKQYGVTYHEEEDQYTDQMMAQDIREKRNALLAETDYYVMPDYPSTEGGLHAVKSYRKFLRNITMQDGFPHSVIWPSKPSVLDTSNDEGEM